MFHVYRGAILCQLGIGLLFCKGGKQRLRKFKGHTHSNPDAEMGSEL